MSSKKNKGTTIMKKIIPRNAVIKKYQPQRKWLIQEENSKK